MTRNDFEKKYENFSIKQALDVDNFFLDLYFYIYVQ